MDGQKFKNLFLKKILISCNFENPQKMMKSANFFDKVLYLTKRECSAIEDGCDAPILYSDY